jgi:hypothetical protein
MRARYYILNPDHSVTTVDDALEWARRFEFSDERVVAKTDRQGFHISTVFLGIDHSSEPPPLLFETMIFRGGVGGDDVYSERYSTWDEALAGHRRALEAVANMEVAE